MHPLEEEMGRLQCKNTFNDIKSNMETPEMSGSASARHEHFSAAEIEKMSLK